MTQAHAEHKKKKFHTNKKDSMTNTINFHARHTQKKKKKNYQQKFSIPMKISILLKWSLHILTKFPHSSKNEFTQSYLHIKFSWFQYPQKPSQDSSNNTTSYIQCKASWINNIVEISQYQTIQQFKKCPPQKKKKDPHDHIMISNQIIQCSKLPQNKQKQNDNVPP